MGRLHVHVSVEDLAEAVRFCGTPLAAAPMVAEPGYAKWMLEDPRMNFAAPARGGKTGVRHVGIQAEGASELEGVFGRLAAVGEATAASVACRAPKAEPTPAAASIACRGPEAAPEGRAS